MADEIERIDGKQALIIESPYTHPMDREAIRGEIADLIAFFKTNYEQFKKQAESNTETKLIERLFGILGWTTNDFEKTSHARRGGRLGRPDYDFKINGKTVFFLEVKKVGISLEKEADAQAISYALSRRVPFAISTNFESLKIFCVEQENAINHVFRIFKKPEDYIENLQDLLFLHKESLEQNLLLNKAEDEGRLKKRISIDRPLLDDLMSIRNMIANDIEKRYPGKYELNEREEIIQRIVDRLIFVRKCEDVGINPDELMLEEIAHNPYGKAHSKLKEIFKRYNEIYNGGLFAVEVDNDCDKIVIDGEIVQKLSRLLYESKDKQYVYNFDWIDADILGQVYEQYLGKILAQTKSGRSKLKNGQAHRKEQGIFYTPTFVVDYIVRNTLGSLLRDKRVDVERIKVLDPACGSGSFLIKAFDYLKSRLYLDDDSKLRRIDEQGIYSVKTSILKNNIYGVDLDPKAVEITKLNLLLKAAEKFRRLPQDVELHIKHGNSLISDQSVAGLTAFEWKGDFQAGTFDVVIGNPPYVRQEEISEIKPYLQENYEIYHGMADLFVYFIEREMEVLKEGGYFGMIVSNKWLRAGYGAKVRDYLSRFWIEKIIDFGDLRVFSEATIYPCILIIRKIRKPNPSIQICKVKTLDFTSLEEYIASNQVLMKQNSLDKNEWNIQSAEAGRLLNKLASSGTGLEEYCGAKINYGIKTGLNEAFVIDERTRNDLIEKDENSEEILKPYLTGEEIGRYAIKSKKKYIVLTKIGVDIEKYPAVKNHLSSYRTKLEKRWDKGDHWYELRVCKYYDSFEKPKIIWGNLATRASFAFDRTGCHVNAPACILLTDSKYVLGILNSRLASFYLKSICAERQGGFVEQKPVYVRKMPIKSIPESQQMPMVALVDKMISLVDCLNDIGDKKTSESAKIEEEIGKTDAEIDAIVYELYGLTEDEIRIVEESLTSPKTHLSKTQQGRQ